MGRPRINFICTAPGCECKAIAGGLCHTHSYRMKARGSLDLPSKPTFDIAFWDKVDRSGGPDACWPWMGRRTPKGYGEIWVPGDSDRRANRVAWSLENGPIPDGLNILHSCDNPPCCNPGHLFSGTQLENIQDRDAKGRQARIKGDGYGNSKLTMAAVLEIRKERAGGASYREIAEKRGVCISTIGNVIRDICWKHVP